MSDARSVDHRFRPRDLPADDLADYVTGKTRQVRHQVSATVRVHASATFVEERMGRWNEETVEVEDAHSCLVCIGGPAMTDIAFWLGILEHDFEIVDSPELADAVRLLAERHTSATWGRRFRSIVGSRPLFPGVSGF